MVVVVLTMRRARLTWRGRARRAVILRAGFALIGLTWWISRADGASDTWTAPPPIMAPPAAQAASFAKAIRTDMIVAFRFPARKGEGAPKAARFSCSPRTTQMEQAIAMALTSIAHGFRARNRSAWVGSLTVSRNGTDSGPGVTPPRRFRWGTGPGSTRPAAQGPGAATRDRSGSGPAPCAPPCPVG